MGSGGYRERVIYAFEGGSDGITPQAGLLADGRGNLYGTTVYGGGTPCANGAGCGIVFALVPSGPDGYIERVIYRFAGGSDGWWPSATLIADAAGNLYGTTQYGGDSPACTYPPQSCGTVFKLTATAFGDYDESIIYRFRGGGDGAHPYAGLLLGAQGVLYGTTEYGGSRPCNSPSGGSGCGTVFALAPQPSGEYREHVLLRFHGSGGALPAAGLTFGPDGDLFGTADHGGLHCTRRGSHQCGTVYRIRPS